MDEQQYYTITTAATDPPVTVEEFKDFAKIQYTSEDTLLEALLEAATNVLESYTNRVFVERTFRGEFVYPACSKFEPLSFITIKQSPLISITNIQQYDSDTSTYVTIDATNYVIKTKSGYSRVLFNTGFVFYTYSFLEVAYPLRSEFIAGFGEAADVPEAIKTAIKMYTKFLHANRGDCAPDTAKSADIPFNIRMVINKYKVIRSF